MTKKITKLMLNGQEYEIREYQGGGGGRQPGANTVAYFPFNSDVIDEVSGNALTIEGTSQYNIVGGATINSINLIGGGLRGTGVDLPTGVSPRTISFWMYATGNYGSREKGIVGYGTDATNNLYSLVMDNSYFQVTNYGNNSYGPSVPMNSWIHIVCLYDGSNFKVYENNSQIISWAYTLNTTGDDIAVFSRPRRSSISDDGGLEGNISQLIIEDKVRTAQEISDYYDLTKGDYGIS